MRPLLLAPLAHAFTLDFPVHALAPAFVKKLLPGGGHPTETPPPATPKALGERAQLAWAKAANLTRSVEAAARAVLSSTTTTTVTPAVASTVKAKAPLPVASASTAVSPSSPLLEAAKEFRRRFADTEHLMPSWDDALSRLRCDTMQSFSSCAQHCFTLLPEFNAPGVQVRDITLQIVPAPATSTHFWWRREPVQQGDLQKYEQLFGMTLNDVRNFKACLLNVCVEDYVISNNMPGCLSVDGTVSVGALPDRRDRPSDTQFDDLDFYQPKKAELYHRFGFFTFNRLVQSILPECNLSTGAGCDLKTTNFLKLMLFVIMFGMPVLLSVLVYPFITRAVRTNAPQPSARCAPPSVRDSPLWPYLVQGLITANAWFVRVERALTHTLWAGGQSVVAGTTEYELVSKVD